MSEEVENAARNVPRSMIAGILINGSLGFGMLLAVLFCLGDVGSVTSTPPTQYPFMAIILQATDSLSKSSAMVSVVIVLGLCATIAFVASSSRMYWSFARDGGLPWSKYLCKVRPTTSRCLWQKNLYFTGGLTHFDSLVCSATHNNSSLSLGPDQHWLVRRIQWCHISYDQWAILFVSDMLCTSSLSTVQRTYSAGARRYGKPDWIDDCEGVILGAFQDSWFPWNRREHRSSGILDHRHFLQLLAPCNPNNTIDHEF